MKRQDHHDDDEDHVIPTMPLLLTLPQAAELCQVGLDRMRQWSYEPGFPVIRYPQQVRVHAELLDEWLKQRARGTQLHRQSPMNNATHRRPP